MAGPFRRRSGHGGPGVGDGLVEKFGGLGSSSVELVGQGVGEVGEAVGQVRTAVVGELYRRAPGCHRLVQVSRGPP